MSNERTIFSVRSVFCRLYCSVPCSLYFWTLCRDCCLHAARRTDGRTEKHSRVSTQSGSSNADTCGVHQTDRQWSLAIATTASCQRFSTGIVMMAVCPTIAAKCVAWTSSVLISRSFVVSLLFHGMSYIKHRRCFCMIEINTFTSHGLLDERLERMQAVNDAYCYY